jgi:hypothetical protein
MKGNEIKDASKLLVTLATSADSILQIDSKLNELNAILLIKRRLCQVMI